KNQCNFRELRNLLVGKRALKLGPRPLPSVFQLRDQFDEPLATALFVRLIAPHCGAEPLRDQQLNPRQQVQRIAPGSSLLEVPHDAERGRIEIQVLFRVVIDRLMKLIARPCNLYGVHRTNFLVLCEDASVSDGAPSACRPTPRLGQPARFGAYGPEHARSWPRRTARQSEPEAI